MKKNKKFKFEYKPLNEYTTEELRDMLKHNNEIDIQWLGGITSEVLRRKNIIDGPMYPKK